MKSRAAFPERGSRGLDASPVEIELDEVPESDSSRRTVTLTAGPGIDADSFLHEFFNHEDNLNVEF